MSKIIAAANSMLANQEKISSVMAGEQTPSEMFFLYDNKYIWSINKSSGHYWLCFYPGNHSVEDIASTQDWDTINFVTYSTKEIGAREALDTFAELYTVAKEKLFGVNQVLDDIISDLT